MGGGRQAADPSLAIRWKARRNARNDRRPAHERRDFGAVIPYDISAAVADGLASDRNIVFAGVAVFFVLLALGFVYDWRKGVFQWR